MFYGWYIVAAGVLLNAYNSAINNYGFTAFIDPIAATFGWSYAQISLATSLRGIETGALNPLMGFMVDRYPAKRLALFGVCILGLGYFCFSRVTNLTMFYVSFLIMGFGGSLGISMVPQASVARWFKKDLGKASGVLFMGNGLGGALIPLLVYSIDTYGWQTSVIYIAIGFLILGIPLCFVFRHSPEQYGLLPDGKEKDETRAPSSQKTGFDGMELGQAMKMRAFWHLVIGIMIQMGVWVAYSIHLMPYFASLGLKRSVGSMTTTAIPLVSLATRFPFGWLSDIFDKRYVLALAVALVSVTLFLFWLIDGSSFSLIVIFIIVAGIAAGGLMPIRIPIYREYFGIKNFGKIYGLGNLSVILGSVTGPPLAGWVYDRYGVYDPIWLILSGVGLIGVIVILTMPSAENLKTDTITGKKTIL
ncbi:MFS transporter [Thermodesulfobacteriota bacterium]